MRKLITIAAAVAAAAALAVPAVANANTTTANSKAYELDNGSTWTLQKGTAAVHTTYLFNGYSDAGIVVDLGSLSDLAASLPPGSGIPVTGTGVADNIWIGNGSEAYTPGTHSLASPVDFCYGFDNQDGTFTMQSSCGANAGLKTLSELAAAYPGAEAFAWVGVVDGGSSVSGNVTAVNGQSVGNRTFSITNNGDGTATAVAH
jgi:hypothetical protein